MKEETIAIIVVTYNRYESFSRLMESIGKIKTSRKDITLIISIEFHENNQNIIDFAKKYTWIYGDKLIVKQTKKLGLKNHILSCGDLSKAYDAVIVLEDDLLVSPYFYDYTYSAIDFYKNDLNIAGISLYSYERAESANFTFKPLYDNYDVYFMQFPSSWGQCWSSNQWKEFKTWLNKNDSDDRINSLVPDFIKAWPKTSWKKLFAAYLIDANKYFVYPKIGLSTNFGEVGQHHLNQLSIRQVDLLTNNMDFNFPNFKESYAKYDIGFELIYHELIKLNPNLEKFPRFDIDMYCQKVHNDEDVILTIAKSTQIIHSFSGRLFPLINNLIFNIQGSELVLTKFKDVVIESVNVDKTKFTLEFKFLLKEIMRLIYYKLNSKNK